MQTMWKQTTGLHPISFANCTAMNAMIAARTGVMRGEGVEAWMFRPSGQVRGMGSR